MAANERWRLREANLADAAAVMVLVNRAYEVEAPFKRTARYIDNDVLDDLMQPQGRFVLCEEHGTGRLLGVIYLLADDHAGVSFGPLAVHPDEQGVGAALLDEAEAQARVHPARTLRCKIVDVRPELPPYYAARGLRPAGTPVPFQPAERLKPGASVHFIELVKHYDA